MSDKIKLIKDFPEKGIYFRHIGPLLQDPFAFKKVIKDMIELLGDLVYEIDVIAGLDARGFIFATAFQWELNKPQVMIRKESKTPGDVYKCDYSREYGKSTVIELEKGLIKPGQKVLIVDDLLATAGTLLGAADLVKQAGAIPFVFLTAIELIGLNGESRIMKEYPESHVKSLFKYNVNSDSTVPIKHGTKPYKTVKYYYKAPYSKIIVRYENDGYIPESSKTILMYHSTLKKMAERILNISKEYRESYVDWGKFPDNWSNITFEPSNTLENRDICFLMSVSSIEIFTEQLCLLIALPRQLINSLTIVIPYLGPATHERVSYSGMLATVEPILKMLSSCIPMTKTGPPVVRIFDIHALQERFYVTDKITLRLMSAIPILKNILRDKKMTIVFPDDGAYKRFQYQLTDLPTIICSKIRDGNERKITIKDKYNWSDLDTSLLDEAIIVDDLVQSGGTILNTAVALKKLGFKKINAYVTHAVFPQNSWTKFIDNDILDTFYVTNTNPEVTEILKNKKKFKVIQIESMIINNNDNKVVFDGDMFYYNNIYNIYVCSESLSKLNGVKKYYDSCDYSRNENIISILGCDSKVNEQPIGLTEILNGCCNRLLHGMEMVKMTNSDSIYSIESGIIYENNIPYEVSVIMIYNPNKNKISLKISDKISLEKYSDIISKLDGTKTFGSIIEEKYGLKKDGWYTFLGNPDRSDFISQAISKNYHWNISSKEIIDSLNLKYFFEYPTFD